MVSGSQAGPAADLARWPSVTLTETQLADLELLLSGAFAPLRGYLEPADAAAVAIRAELADGTPWPIAVTLDLPASVSRRPQIHVALADGSRSLTYRTRIVLRPRR